MIRILIVDEHQIVRQGLRYMLATLNDVEIVGDVASGEDALSFVREHPVDVVVLELFLPGISGIETIKRLSQSANAKSTQVVVLTKADDGAYPMKALQIGACAYLSKDCDLSELESAIQKASKAESYITPLVAQRLALNSVKQSQDSSAAVDNLSERELEVMRMIAKGMKVTEIAQKLCLSSKTVNAYRYRIFDKLKIANDVEITLVALRLQLIDSSLIGAT